MTINKKPTRWATLAAASLAAIVAACGSSSGSDPVQIVTLSNRADLLSDGDALVEIVLPANASTEGLSVMVEGRDLSSAFARRADGRVTGVITGMKTGTNVITARTNSARQASLTVTNAPRGGPIFSGAQVLPFVCATPTSQAATGTTPATNPSGLSTTATDSQCNIATEMKLYYKSTAANCTFSLPDPSPSILFTSAAPAQSATPPANSCFKPYTLGSNPTDMATATTDNGVTLPYIIRVERGTMNRGLYDIAVLYNPNQAWSSTSPQAQWNGKVFYTFGSSTGQPRRQLRPQASWTDDRALSRGYVWVTNSMTDSAQNSNRVMMTETVMMMKEHIIDTYGPVKFTMGSGCSGGSINSHMTASIMPNLVDGYTVSCAYPDSETTGIEVLDCSLLVEAYQKPKWLAAMQAAGYTQSQINAKKTAINGHEDPTACHGWFNSFGSNAKAGNYFQRTVSAANMSTGVISTSTTSTNNCQLPASQVYDAVTNPNGARCNAWSWAESIYGRVPGSVQANDTRDNVGVQYGLKALKNGMITPEEFVTLNEIIGGFDRDTNLRSERSVADPAGLEVAYRAGLILNGKQYAKHAVIDLRGYDDSLTPATPVAPGTPLFGIHHQWRSFSIRDRLVRDFGDSGNQVLWRFGLTGFSAAPGTMATDAFLTMDRWLTALKNDTSASTIEQKVRASKPAGTTDLCILSTDPTQSVKVTSQATCDADPLLVPKSSPRQVAGGARTEDVMKCQLKALDTADYAPQALTAEQVTRMRAVFSQGVCDFSKKGVSQQDPVGFLTFKGGAGGQSMSAQPVSTAVQ
jgi:hypothetical protein